MNIAAIGAGALAAWYYALGGKKRGADARDERALKFLQSKEGKAAAAAPAKVQAALNVQAVAAMAPAIPAMKKAASETALKVLAAEESSRPAVTLAPPAPAPQPVRPAPKAIPALMIVTPTPAPPTFSKPSTPQQRAKATTQSMFVKRGFEPSGPLMPKADTSRTRPPILPNYLKD